MSSNGAFGNFIVSTGPTGPTGAGSDNIQLTGSSVFSLYSSILSQATASLGCEISQSFQSLRGIAMLRSLNQTIFERIGVRFNDDTGPNYAYNTHHTAFSGTITTLAQINSGAYVLSGASGGDFGLIISNRGMTGVKTFVDFEIPFYTGTNNYKIYTCYSNSFFPHGGTTGDEDRHTRAAMIQGIWMSMSPITKISFYQMSGGLFDLDSSLIIHGEN